MRTTPSPTATAGRTLARVVTAGFSLLVLVVAVAGLPLLLAWATPVIWAATHDDALHLLDRQDTGSVFLLLLVAVGWIGWAQFTFCAVGELIAQVRGRTWHAPRGMGAAQRAAALLIGSILVLLPTSSALASDAQAAPATSAAHVPGQAQARQATETRQAPTAAASTRASGTTTYTVRETRPAQSLWGIAEQELGDGERWREIAELNEGRTMADGTVFRANSFLQPGWQLQMPEGAASAAGVRTQLDARAPAADEKGEHVVTVHPGDYLSKIAKEELGDGDEWPELFEASKGRPQPHGLPKITDPDMIFAGQQVTVPGARPDQSPQERGQGEESGGKETAPPATQNPGGEQTPGDGTGDAPRQTTTPAPASSPPSSPSHRPAEQPGQGQSSSSTGASATPEPSASASPSAASPSASAPQSSGSAASSPAARASQTPASAPSDGPLNLRIVLGAGALLAAAITGALALRRTLQRRRRKPGETIAIASETSPAEAQLAAAAEPDGAARLDVALRTLAHHVAQQEDAVLPPLRAARIASRALQVLPEDPAQDPVAPFTPGPGGWWVLPADATLLDDEAAREVPAPYPGLVTIGHTEAGDLLLPNLAALPALLLDGNPVHITEVCTSLALELGMSPWAADVEVVTVGFGEDLPQLLPTARIAHLRQPAHALRDLSERLLEAHQMPESQHQPYLLLCAAALDEDTAWQLADLIDKARAVPVTLIAPAGTAAAHFPQAQILNASVSDPQPLDAAATDIRLQRLEHAAYQQITTALKVSGQPAHPAEGPWQHVPDEPDIRHEPAPGEAVVPAPGTGTTASPASGADGVGEVFPALLAATTDPSALRLPPATTPPPAAEDEPEPGTDAPSAPATEGTPDQDAQAEQAPEKRPVPQADGGATHDLHAPEIRVLGPVEVDGVAHTGHGPRMAQLAALLYFRPGRSADVLCSAMDPVHPWSPSTLNARMQGLRSCLGSDSCGSLYVPRRKTGEDPYRLAPGVRCDWTRFLHLAEHALPLGPTGLTDLEKALSLVRGRPFGGKPLPWAEPLQQEMITRIIDVAHTVATHRTPEGPHHDLNAARHAVTTGLDIDETAELLYRDWLRIEHAAGNRHGLHTAIARIQHVNQALDCSLEAETEQLINSLLNTPGTAVRKTL
ncbi:LysM peptidoglycan-binding domain-containing protein [Streptomyces cylindrosporus]|uniref:LysM peptidoglycan-binding domain-containing protein n=1 Tax=Streptomyces cylindrosporus TaxID=2927583 RepID=A0ABS9Y821_9ACTN|nr:LysM peptidoglycan-binding domain-containing protein [Streptomyces cylindrosporus]MCI3273373.1 LysM peptidoglycan-binding domain-containing protein [Streptomyces cylindrosporus]